MFSNVIKRVQEGQNSEPTTKFLIVYIFSGYCLQVDGQLVILLNQFDKATRYYKFIGVEKKMRTIAEMYANTYQVAFFTTCKQNYIEKLHTGIGFPSASGIDEFEQKEEETFNAYKRNLTLSSRQSSQSSLH